MVEYAQSLLTTITDMGIVITAGIQEKMNYLQEALDDIAVRAMVCKDTDARYGVSLRDAGEEFREQGAQHTGKKVDDSALLANLHDAEPQGEYPRQAQ